MKIEVTFTHRGFFYGLPVLISFRGDDGFFPVPLIPLTGWCLTYVVPAIQRMRNMMIHLGGSDTPERDHFVLHGLRPLKRPRVRVFDWPEEAVREFLAESHARATGR
jgi:hypothetical protein